LGTGNEKKGRESLNSGLPFPLLFLKSGGERKGKYVNRLLKVPRGGGVNGKISTYVEGKRKNLRYVNRGPSRTEEKGPDGWGA